MSGQALPPSLRLHAGDTTLTVAELRRAIAEVNVALELDASEATRANLRLLLDVARGLIALKAS